MSETRSSSALFKRAEQLKRWEESETNRQPSEMGNKPKKIKFSSGCVFLAACASTDKEEVLNLLKSGADINTANVDGLTALHQACIDNNMDMVEFLVENHADVNRGDNEGWTPLHATASCGFLSIAKYLIDHGANVAACNNDGELAIDIAESDEMEDLLQRHIELQGINPDDARTFEERSMLEDAKYWLSSGCLGDVPNPKTGASALHVAAAKGYIKVMNVLIQAGSDLNCQDYDGWTALHAAAHWAQREACQILVEHFCDMDVKNYVGQTCFDIADPELITFLEDLRKKQASMERSQQDINNIANKQQMRNNVLPKRRLSTDRSPLSKSGAEVPKPGGGGGDNGSSLRGEEDAGTPADKMAKVEMRERSAPSGNDRSEPAFGSEDEISEDDVSSSSASSASSTDEQTDEMVLEGLKNQLNREDTSPKISQNNNINNTPSVPNNNTVTSPTSPKTEEEIFWKPASGLRRKTTDTTRNAVNLNLPKDVDSSDPSQTEGTPPDVALRRTRSFDTDEKRGTAVTKEDSSRTSVNTPAAVNTTSNPGSPPSSTTTSPQNSLTTSVRSAPTTPTTPTTPGGSKLSPSNIFKNFFKSFVPPVRDEESETQRKAHAKRVRETRRSTQGVTLEELKSAEQLVKKKQQQQLVQASQQPPSPEKETPDNSDRSNTTHSQSNSLPPHPPGVTVSATITSNSSSSSPLAHTGERRPSWRLRVDNGVKFMLEDARDNPSNTDRTRGATDTAETTVTIPLRRPGKLNVDSDKEQDKENDSRNAQATQAVIQRRKRPKRRSTGVVHVDLDEILDRGDDSNHTQSGGDNISTSRSRVNSESAGTGNNRKLPNEVTNGELDYKKLYEESQAELARMKETLSKTEEELTQVKATYSKNSLSEQEKRERRTMERKLSEMEVELKELDQFKKENQRLKDENGALIRVISKLSK
uniref:Protein phosphatase 1 regulatory subunit 12B n=1 Tax=Cacopsylla melanoneura TaxID=428564 RepID=A0A8D8ZYU2_9HEMI